MNQGDTKQRSIVVLGFSMVGKTAICIRFAKHRFDEQYEPTYENSWHRLYEHRGQMTEIIIKDTQGLSDQEIFRHEYGLGYHGYVLVYSISSQRSLDTLKGIHEKLLNLTVNTNIPRVLVGNKTDLARHAREVSMEEGQALAAEWGCAFVECSAKWNQGVDEVFQTLLDEIEVSSHPAGGYGLSSSRCLDFLCCANRGNSNSYDGNEESSFQVSDSRRLEKWVKFLILFTFCYGLFNIVWGMSIAAGSNTTDGQLLAYILLGIGFIVSLISVLGYLGVRQNSQDFLKVFAISLLLIVMVEIVAWITLYTKMAIFKNYLVESLTLLCIGITAQIAATCVTFSYQAALAPQLVLHHMTESPYHSGFTGDYYNNLSDLYT